MIADLVLIKELPSFITEIFNNDINRLINCISILDESITDGIVYKVSLEDKLDTMGYETFFLYLPLGSSLKKNVDEDYIGCMVIDGDLGVGNHKFKSDEIMEIGPVLKNTIIYVYRRKRSKIKEVINDS